jgi:hypothetical protein
MEQQLQHLLADLHAQLQEAQADGNASEVERIRKRQSDCLAVLVQRFGAHTRRTRLRLRAAAARVRAVPSALTAWRALRNLLCAASAPGSAAAAAPAHDAAVDAAAAALAALRVDIQEPPSMMADRNVWARYQFLPAGGEPAFACFRPLVGPPLALPAALVCPVFAAFLDDCEVPLASLGRCDLESSCAAQLLAEMPRCFRREHELQHTVNTILSRLLGHTVSAFRPASDSRSETGGGILVNIAGVECLLFVPEYKADVGTSGDPYMQLQRTYQLYLDAPERRSGALLARDCCPAFALEVVGPLMRVSALASLRGNRVLCEPLTPFLHFLCVRDQPRYCERLVVMLRALRTAMGSLTAHYEEVLSQVGDGVPPAAAAAGGGRDARLALPHPLRDAARFTHVTHLCPDKLVYAAVDARHAGNSVCVKFSRSGDYGADVHAAWARAGLAPELLSVDALPGGLRMVVMQLLPRTDGWCMLSKVSPPAARVAALAAALAALCAAHALPLPAAAADGVHGDCRACNVLVRRRRDGAKDTEEATCPSSPHDHDHHTDDCGAAEWDIRFVDFDWSGAAGARAYPPFMSAAVQWPVGALPGTLLEQAHDTQLPGCARV